MGTRARAIAFLALLLMALAPFADVPSAAVSARGMARVSTGSPRHVARPTSRQRSAVSRPRSSGTRQITQYLGSRRRVVSVRRHRLHHRIVRQPRREPGTRYAYALELFMIKAPEFDQTPLPPDQAKKLANAFNCGNADHIPARALVRAGVAQYYPMRGGIFWRREPVKYIVVHSTETGIPLNAKRVIDSWTSMGRRHPGAQYVVDRDGTIYQAVDPDLATVHVNIFKTLPGINNDNSIGIEMVHSGRQTYTPEQRTSVIRLVHYLQDRYKVSDESVITHRYAQQGDHTDPVAFSWDNFLRDKSRFRSLATASRMSRMVDEAETAWRDEVPSTATTYLQIHTTLPPNPALSVADPPKPELVRAAEVRPLAAPSLAPALSEAVGDPACADPAPPPAMAREPDAPTAPSRSATADSLAQPSLRGEIEVHPKTAGLLLNAPVGSADSTPEGQTPVDAIAPSPAEAPGEVAAPSPAPAPEEATATAVTPPISKEPAAIPDAAPAEPTEQPASVEYFLHQPTAVGPR